MVSTDKDDKSKFILESINNRLASLEEKIDSINTKTDREQKKGMAFFQASTLFATGLVVISIALSLLIQLVSDAEFVKWMTCISYFVVGITLIVVAIKSLR